MKIVLTGGHPYSGYPLAHHALVAAGLAQALPSRREGVSATELHTKMCKAYGLDPLAEGPLAQMSPGKVWQNLAVDLLMANLDGESWGWADGNMLGFLEFWRDFDPQIRFLLVYSEPAFAVGQMLRNGLLAHGDIQRAVASWEVGNAELLRFYNRNADRCLLVNVSVAIQAPADLVGKAASAFGLALDLPTDYQVDWTGLSAIASSLAKGLLDDYPEAAALYQEMESSADLDGLTVSQHDAEKPQVWQEFSQLLASLDQTTAARDAQARLAEERQARLDQAAETSAEQTRETAELRLEVEQLAQSCRGRSILADELRLRLEQTAEARNEQARLAVERQALLEQAAEASAEQSRQAAELNEEIDRLTRTCGEQAAQAAELGTKLAQAQNAESAAQAEIARLQVKAEEIGQENQHLQGQLRQIQQESENWYLKLQAYAGIEQSLTAARDEQARLATEHQQEIERLAQENQFLLSQMRQVQADLEHYFLQYQDLAGRGRQEQPQPGVSVGFGCHPCEIVFDLRRGFNGDNWYEVEHDGRWAGPKDLSSIKLPPLPGGLYEVRLDIVDAMDPEILLGMEVSLNGKLLRTNDDWEGFPASLYARFDTEQIGDRLLWEFQFKFPKLISPSESGADDARKLAIRMRSLKLSLLE